MDRKEAIEYAKFRLECHTKGDGEYTDYGEFLVAAIEALQEPQVSDWIPVSERLPDKTDDEYYPISLVTLDNGDVCLGVYRYDDEEWWTRMSEGEYKYTNTHKVIAWQPLPEPYKESEKE